MAVLRTSAGADRIIAGRRPVVSTVMVAAALLAVLLTLIDQIGVPSVYGTAALVAVFVGASLYAGLRAGTGYVSDWLFSANRAVSPVVGMALAAAMLSGPIMISMTGLFMADHPMAAVLLIAMMVGLTLFAILLAPYLRNSGAVSPASFVGLRFDHALLRIPAVVAVMVLCLLLLWAQLRAGILLAGLFFGIGAPLSALCLVLLIGTMVLPGGQFGVIRSNLVYYAVVAISFLLPLVWLCLQAPTVPVPQLGAGVAFAEIAALEQQLAEFGIPAVTEGMQTGWPATGSGLPAVLPLLVCTAGFFAMPAMLGGCQASPHAASARTSGLAALIYSAIIITAAPAAAAFAELGIYANVMGLTAAEMERAAGWVIRWSSEEALSSPQAPLVSLCGQGVQSGSELVAACGGDADFPIGPADLRIHGDLPAVAMAELAGVPGILSVFAVAGIFAALLSTANAASFMLAVTVGDGTREIVAGGRPTANLRLFMLRAAGAAALAGTAALAATLSWSPVDLTLWSLGLGAALAPLLIATVWWDRLSLAGAALGVIVPLTITLGWFVRTRLPMGGGLWMEFSALADRMLFPQPLMAGLVAMTAAVAAMAAASLFRRGEEPAQALATIRAPGHGRFPDQLQ